MFARGPENPKAECQDAGKPAGLLRGRSPRMPKPCIPSFLLRSDYATSAVSNKGFIWKMADLEKEEMAEMAEMAEKDGKKEDPE